MHDEHQITDKKKWSEVFRTNVSATWLIVTLKDGTEYQGKYLRTEKGFVYFNQFKSKNKWLARSFSIHDVTKGY